MSEDDLNTDEIKTLDNTKDFLNFWQNTTYYNYKYRNKIAEKLNTRASLQFRKGTQIIAFKKIF